MKFIGKGPQTGVVVWKRGLDERYWQECGEV